MTIAVVLMLVLRFIPMLRTILGVVSVRVLSNVVGVGFIFELSPTIEHGNIVMLFRVRSFYGLLLKFYNR